MIEKQNNMVIQHPDKRLMERIRSLERNERIRLHIAQMKCSGYTDDECKTWLIKNSHTVRFYGRFRQNSS